MEQGLHPRHRFIVLVERIGSRLDGGHSIPVVKWIEEFDMPHIAVERAGVDVPARGILADFVDVGGRHTIGRRHDRHAVRAKLVQLLDLGANDKSLLVAVARDHEVGHFGSDVIAIGLHGVRAAQERQQRVFGQLRLASVDAEFDGCNGVGDPVDRLVSHDVFAVSLARE